MTVYADVLFLVNFSLDYVTLYITGRLMSLSSSLLRMSLSSVMGAFFAVSALVFDMKGVLYIIMSAAVTFLMTVCAYKRAGKMGYIGASLLMFSVGTAIGGAVTAVCSLGEGYRGSIGSDVTEDAAVFAVAGIAAVITALSARAAKRRQGIKRQSVSITVHGDTLMLEALCDSGSLVRDPLSCRPVLIVRADALREILPLSVCSAVGGGDVTEIDLAELSRIRMIPVSGVGGHRILLGYRPDSVTVGKRQVDCLIALSDDKKTFGGCDAILPSELI